MVRLLTLLVLLQDSEHARLAELLAPSVVRVGNEEGYGSGMVFDDRGLILTNAHVILSPTPLTVDVQGFSYRRVTLVGVHPTKDVALLRIDPAEHRVALVPLKVARTRAVSGEALVTMGFPSDYGGNRKVLSGAKLIANDRFGDMPGYQEYAGVTVPGNSGGPLCTMRGEAIGLVTLGNWDPTPSGMAVPIYDLKADDFVPMSRRTSNPANANRLLALGEKVLKAAHEKQGRGAEIARELFAFALLEDFSNSDIYFKIGMLSRNLGQHAHAAAYLVRSLRLKPWPDSASECYHELGVALAKMGKDPAALVVWKEGVSKYPTEGRIWDALAIYQAGRGRAMEAALASRASLKAFGDRGTVMNEIYKLSRERLSVEELATLREREQGLDEELRRWKAAADEARRAATPYLTPECARFIRDYEGAQKEWVASSSSSASAAEASPASGRVRVFVKPVDPWVYQKAGMWFRFKTTVGRTEHYEDLGLKAKDSTSNTFTSQRFREGQAEPVQETHAKHPQYRIYGEEKVQVGDRSFACEVRSWIAEPGAPETEDREWVVPGGRYAGAVLKATAPRRTLVAKKVWDHALKIQGREFDCVVVESESRSDGAVTSVKTWYSANLPTALRMETDEIAVTLVDYGFAWSDRPAFPGAQKK